MFLNSCCIFLGTYPCFKLSLQFKMFDMPSGSAPLNCTIIVVFMVLVILIYLDIIGL